MSCIRKCKDAETTSYININLAQGQYLLHVIKVSGAKGIFNWADQLGHVIFSEQDWPEPQDIYQRRWPEPHDPPVRMGETEYGTSFSFVVADLYTYVLTLHQEDGTKLKTVKNCEYSKERSEDACFEDLTVNRVG